jgi:hypothetical protein
MVNGDDNSQSEMSLDREFLKLLSKVFNRKAITNAFSTDFAVPLPRQPF